MQPPRRGRSVVHPVVTLVVVGDADWLADPLRAPAFPISKSAPLTRPSRNPLRAARRFISHDQRPSARSALHRALGLLDPLLVRREIAVGQRLVCSRKAACASLSALVAAGLSLARRRVSSALPPSRYFHRSFLEHLVQRLLQGVPDPDD